jgi:hypothetical protein
MAAPKTYRIRFATTHTEEDLEVSLAPTELIATLIDEVRARRAVPAFKQVRLICSGRELYPDDPLYKVSSVVVLCMISDVPPPPPLDEPPPVAPAPPSRLQRLLDWLDTIDPAVVLMWASCILLSIAWLTLLFMHDTYADRNSTTVSGHRDTTT